MTAFMRSGLPLLLILLAAGAAFGDEPAPAAKPKLVLMELRAAGAPKGEVTALGDSLCTEAGSLGRFELLCPPELQAILQHQSMARLMGCTGGDCVKELAGLVSADWLLMGSVGKVGEVFTLNLQLMNASTSKVVARATRKADGDLGKLLGEIRPILDEVCAKMKPAAAPKK